MRKQCKAGAPSPLAPGNEAIYMYMHAQMMEVAGHNRQLQTVWHMVWAAANARPPHNRFSNTVSQLIVSIHVHVCTLCMYASM